MVRYVDTAAEKSDQNHVAARHMATKQVRQQDGVETVLRQRERKRKKQ
jgi:hypothetical protein